MARVALVVLVYGRTGSAALTGLTGLTFAPALLGGLGDRYRHGDDENWLRPVVLGTREPLSLSVRLELGPGVGPADMPSCGRLAVASRAPSFQRRDSSASVLRGIASVPALRSTRHRQRPDQRDSKGIARQAVA